MAVTSRVLFCSKCGDYITDRDNSGLLPQHKDGAGKKCPGSYELGLAPKLVPSEEEQNTSSPFSLK